MDGTLHQAVNAKDLKWSSKDLNADDAHVVRYKSERPRLVCPSPGPGPGPISLSVSLSLSLSLPSLKLKLCLSLNLSLGMEPDPEPDDVLLE